MKLKGKTAIVTGGGRDIGRACAMKLAEAGANVAINYFSSSAGADCAVKEINANGGKAFALKGDLNAQADVGTLVDKTVEQFGGVDILVNNTGGLIALKTMAEMDLDHWRAVMDLNLTSTFLMIKACLPHLKSGAIVNLASRRDATAAGRDRCRPQANGDTLPSHPAWTSAAHASTRHWRCWSSTSMEPRTQRQAA